MRYNEAMDSNITSIIVAIIAAISSIVGAYLACRRSNREQEIKDAQREQRQADRLDIIDEKIGTLSKKVDIHNGYAEKFGEISKNMAVMAKDIEFLKSK